MKILAIAIFVWCALQPARLIVEIRLFRAKRALLDVETELEKLRRPIVQEWDLKEEAIKYYIAQILQLRQLIANGEINFQKTTDALDSIVLRPGDSRHLVTEAYGRVLEGSKVSSFIEPSK